MMISHNDCPPLSPDERERRRQQAIRDDKAKDDREQSAVAALNVQHRAEQVAKRKAAPDYMPGADEAKKALENAEDAYASAPDAQRAERGKTLLAARNAYAAALVLAEADEARKAAEEARRETPEYQAQVEKLTAATARLVVDLDPEVKEIAKLALKLVAFQGRLDAKVSDQQAAVVEVKTLRSALGMPADPTAKYAPQCNALFMLANAVRGGK